MNITISIDSRDVQRLLQVAPARTQRALVAGMTDATIYMQRLLMDYPEQRKGSTYKRTHTLDRSWLQPDSRRIRRTAGGGVEGGVFSSKFEQSYNRLVQDADNQAQVHRTTWRGHTVQAIAAAKERDVQRMFSIRLAQEFGR